MVCELSFDLVQQTPDQDCFINCQSRIYCALWDTIPIQNLVKEVSCIFLLPDPITDFCIMVCEDNLSAISMAESLKFTPCTNYIAIKYHHFCSRVPTSFNKSGDIKLKYISTKQQTADILTKPVDDDSFFKLRHMLCGW
jgi:hypothetical protein